LVKISEITRRQNYTNSSLENNHFVKD